MSTRISQFRRVPPICWLVLLWLLLTIPGMFIRSAHYEEGATIGLARGAFEDGHWMAPHLYGMRFVERPVLVSWGLAAAAKLTGRMDLWTARLPAVTSILAGTCLIYWLVRRYSTARAAVFGGCGFLVSPMILQKIVTAEPDTVVSMLLFAALLTWWTGFERGRTSAIRWLVIGLILGIAALLKGPQPLGYFFLGLTAYLVLRREWLELGKLAATAIMPALTIAAWYIAVFQPGDLQLWLSHSRLGAIPTPASYLWRVVRVCLFIAIQSLPAILFAIPLATGRWRRETGKTGELITLLLLYTGVCTLVLVLWPGANGRYAMPGLLGLAACAGLAFERVRLTNPLMFRSGIFIALALATYGITVNCVAMPAFPDRFRKMALEGRLVATVIGNDRQPVYVSAESMNRNLLVYLRSPVRLVSLGNMPDLAPPFWAIVSGRDEKIYRTARPDIAVKTRLDLMSGNLQLLQVE